MSHRPGGVAASALSSRCARSSSADHLDLRAGQVDASPGAGRAEARGSQPPLRPAMRCRSARRSSTATRCACVTPSPVEALPCGSRSTSSTRQPIAASAVARLIAGRRLADAALLIGHRDADHRLRPHPRRRPRSANSASVTLCSTWNTPCHARRASASSALGAPALWKHPHGFSCGQMCGYFRASRASGATARAVITSNVPVSALRLAEEHCGAEIERFAHPVEKFRAQPARLDQRHGSFDQAGDDNSRQAGARSRCRPTTRRRAARSAPAAPNRGCAAPTDRSSVDAETRFWRALSSRSSAA